MGSLRRSRARRGWSVNPLRIRLGPCGSRKDAACWVCAGCSSGEAAEPCVFQVGSGVRGMTISKAQSEAEAFCAQLNNEGHVDACITYDSDALFFGAKCVIKCLQSNSEVKEQGPQKSEASLALVELLHLEEQAKQELGRWSKVPGASDSSIRNLPPSAIGDPSNLDAPGFLAANKGKPMQAIVEQITSVTIIRHHQWEEELLWKTLQDPKLLLMIKMENYQLKLKPNRHQHNISTTTFSITGIIY